MTIEFSVQYSGNTAQDAYVFYGDNRHGRIDQHKDDTWYYVEWTTGLAYKNTEFKGYKTLEECAEAVEKHLKDRGF